MVALLSVMSVGRAGLTTMVKVLSNVSPSESTTCTPMGMLVTLLTAKTVLVWRVLPLTANRPALAPVSEYANVWLAFGSVVLSVPMAVCTTRAALVTLLLSAMSVGEAGMMGM